MSLKSVDLQTAIPKSTEIAKVKQVEDRDAGNRQQQFATQFQRRVERRQQQVTSSPDLRQSRVDPDAQGDRGGEQAPDDGRRPPAEGRPGESPARRGKPEPGPGKGKRLDITI
ncbi:MAG: hypothetical protein ACYC9Q_00010 [Bacillota bacterium]